MKQPLKYRKTRNESPIARVILRVTNRFRTSKWYAKRLLLYYTVLEGAISVSVSPALQEPRHKASTPETTHMR